MKKRVVPEWSIPHRRLPFFIPIKNRGRYIIGGGYQPEGIYREMIQINGFVWKGSCLLPVCTVRLLKIRSSTSLHGRPGSGFCTADRNSTKALKSIQFNPKTLKCFQKTTKKCRKNRSAKVVARAEYKKNQGSQNLLIREAAGDKTVLVRFSEKILINAMSFLRWISAGGNTITFIWWNHDMKTCKRKKRTSKIPLMPLKKIDL